jgi:hypothetical protein
MAVCEKVAAGTPIRSIAVHIRYTGSVAGVSRLGG